MGNLIEICGKPHRDSKKDLIETYGIHLIEIFGKTILKLNCKEILQPTHLASKRGRFQVPSQVVLQVNNQKACELTKAW